MGKEPVEIIKCLCGSIIAASVVKYIDAQWITNKKNYIKMGYTTSVVDTTNFQFGECKCSKEKPKAITNQLELF